MRRVLLMTCGGLLLAGCGGGADPGPDVDRRAPGKVALAVSSPGRGETVAESPTTFRGTSTPGASVTVDGEVVRAGPSGRWSAKVDLDGGSSTYPIVAQKEGLSFAAVDYPVTLRQSAAERAAARRAEARRVADVARRKRARAARRNAQESPAPDRCRTPDATMLGSVAFALRQKGSASEIDRSRAALVVESGVNYLAVPVVDAGPAVVLVSFPDSGEYLRATTALNGTARSLTNLPGGPDSIPAAGDRALECADEAP